MNDDLRFRWFVAITSILILPFAIANGATFFGAVNGNSSAFFNPASLVAMGEKGANLMRWSMAFDLFGYLMVAPLVLWIEQWLHPKSPNFIRLYTACGLTYSLLGAIGAVIVAAVVPNLAIQYASAPEAQRPMLELTLSAIYQAVALGIWNPLEVLMAGIWLMGTGSMMRKERPVYGISAFCIGAFVLLDVVGRLINNDAIFNLGAVGMVFLPLWALCFGIDLFRRPAKQIGIESLPGITA